ncbi:glycerophosphoryl diester phosphodiesterase [Sinomicrobium oceani]|uniref:Glycerophosphoryl diester phosphodiesterase n=1 Tax=Sinomicrobium oceani TaxID=1150368 RepID=A0A1K1MA84_9FLAO|nr:glycerophosphodiester phosphodiesterase family protein [Sinomicrobium oceani]SFW20037.1 glycerophosphoryl diester phosphodiesterase [Sinomicrobium oceani]
MSKNLFFIAFLLLFSRYGFGQDTAQLTTRTDSILYRLKHPVKNEILVVSHRGDWRYAPENSLMSIQRCIDLGVDIVEIDVRLTKDGHLVAMHDKTVNRTTDGKGKVSDMTLEEIKKLRLKNACGVKGSRQQVPTLEEIMFLAKDKIMVNLDKVEGETVKEAYKVLKETGTVGQVIFKGRETADMMLEKFGDIMKEIIYMPILIDNTENASGFVDRYNELLSPIAYEVTFSGTDTENFKQIARLNRMGITVLNIPLWDALTAGHTDEKALLEGADEAWGWLIKNGANAIMTDRLNELLNYLEGKGLRKH